MNKLLFSLMTMAAQWFRPRYNIHLQLLEAQLRISGGRESYRAYSGREGRVASLGCLAGP
jgi:hypothetical protein